MVNDTLSNQDKDFKWKVKVKAEPNVAAFLKSAHRMPSPADKATGDTYYKEVMTSLGWA